MKTILRNFLSLTAVVALILVNATARGATVGAPAPDFALSDIDGQAHKLSEFKGKIVVLEWVNPECPFVRRHYESGNIPSLQREASVDGVVWLSINSAAAGNEGDFDAAKVKAWSSQVKAVPTAYFRDQIGTVGKLYGAKTTPHMFVINADGVLVYEGAIDSDRKHLEGAVNYVRAALTAVRAGKPVEKPVTEPYGCSVKY